MIRVRGFDHLVLRVADVERSLAWYTHRLGLAGERVDAWRRGEVLFPSVRVDASTIIDLLAAPRRADERGDANVDHVCLVIGPTDLVALADSDEFDVVGGPSAVFGAQGMGESVYVRDPDGNVVELRTYPVAPSGR